MRAPPDAPASTGHKNAVHAVLGPRRASPPYKPRFILLAAALFLALALAAPLAWEPRIVLALTIAVALLWISEALPLYVTGLLVPLTLTLLLGTKPEAAFAPFFDPVIALLLGGFVLAMAIQAHGLDRIIAAKFVNRVGAKPWHVLLGLCAATAFISFWISNTAAALIMLPIGLSILRRNNCKPLSSNFGKATVLSIAYGATIGGLGTVIGSTPNVMAVKFLADQGVTLSFADWLWFGLPMVAVLVPAAVLILLALFRPELPALRLERIAHRVSRDQKAVAAIFALTVLLWVTNPLHRIPDSVVALVPLLLCFASGLLAKKHFLGLEWDLLIFFGGGLALGSAIQSSGLASLLASGVQAGLVGQPVLVIALAVAAIGIVLTSLTSNTAASALYVPLMIPLAAALGLDIKWFTVLAAVGVSLDFMLPIGTPPDTAAFGTGYLRFRDMLLAGAAVSIVGALAAAFLFLGLGA